MRKLGRQRRVTKRWNPYGATSLLAMAVLQGAAHAQAKPAGLAAHEGLLTTGFFGLLVTFVALVAWEVADSRKASRSSLDIAKLAAAAAKKQSAAGAPSGSLAQLDAPPTSRPFAPPPPPPPPKQPAASAEPARDSGSPFAPPPAREEAPNPFAAPPSEMIGSSAGSVESTVAFSPTGNDAGSSGGWADLLQRVRAGEPEAASFEASGPPSTEEEAFSMSGEQPAPTAASSSEAWEALLRRTTTGEGPAAPKAPAGGDVGKISLNSSFQVPGSAEMAQPPAPSPFGSPGGSPFGGAPGDGGNMFGASFDDGSATLPSTGPPGAFSLPSQPPAAAEPPALGMGFSFNDPAPEPASPFGGFGGAGFGSAPPTPGAGGSGGFESPGFKLPGSAAKEDLGGGGFQLPSGSALGSTIGTNPFDFAGGGVPEHPSSSTLPLNDLFGSKAPGQAPSFQLPSSGGGLDFSGGADSDPANPGLGRTISLDFAKGGGQKPPPPLPKTEG